MSDAIVETGHGPIKLFIFKLIFVPEIIKPNLKPASPKNLPKDLIIIILSVLLFIFFDKDTSGYRSIKLSSTIKVSTL